MKPGLLQNEVLGTADPLYTILFVGLWMMADREGRLEDKPLKITALAFPYRRKVTEKKVDSMLTWLHDHGFIIRYEIKNSGKYIQVVEFSKHQRPHSKEAPSIIPALTSIQHQPEFDLGSNLGSGEHALIPDSGFLIPDSNTISSNSSTTGQSGAANGHGTTKGIPPAEQVFAHWQTTHNHPQAKLDAKRRRLIDARLKDGFSIDDLKQAITGYLHSPFHQGENKDHKIYDSIELMMRNVDKVEAGIDFDKRASGKPTSKPAPRFT